MTGVGKRITAALTVLGAAALSVALGVSASNADEPKTPAPAQPAAPRLEPQTLPRLFPDGPGAFGADLQKAQEQMFRAMEALAKNPNDAAARKQMDEAQRALMAALGGADRFPGAGFPGTARATERARLGVRLAPLTPLVSDQLGLEGTGAAVAAVLDGSVAEKAGFKVHDIVVEFAGKPVTDPADFARRVNDAKAGEKVDAVVVRKGKRVELKGIELPEVPRDPMALPPNPKAAGEALPGGVNSVSVSVSGDAFTIDAQQEGVSYHIAGKTGPDGAAVEKVRIKAGDETVEAQELGKVPEKYRATVEKLLKSVGKPGQPRAKTKVID